MRLGFKLTLKDWVKIKGGDSKRNLLLLLNKLLSENYFTSSKSTSVTLPLLPLPALPAEALPAFALACAC